MSFVTMILPFILKALDWAIDKSAENKELRKKYLELVDLMTTKGMVTSKLRDSYLKKRKRLEKT